MAAALVICDPPPPERGLTMRTVTYPPTTTTTAPFEPPVIAATWPVRLPGPQPWQCPACRVWNGPMVAQHRCTTQDTTLTTTTGGTS